jgi:cellulose synthase operon protein YhjQ
MDRPSWLYQESPVRQTQPQPQPSAPDSFVDTRERVASRWFALRGVFEAAPASTAAQKELRPPVTAVFSLAGGVGKTSLVATLGRALSAAGERVLLTDTTSYGLLPFYYGARELRPGVVRTFTPPQSASDSPVNMVSYDVDAQPVENDQDWLVTEVSDAGRNANRVLIDLATASSAVAKRILRMRPTVVVPIVPDMSSVIGLSAVEQFFRTHSAPDGQPIKPYYILNQFDPSQPLHLDVREVLRRQLGDRLLPLVLRRSQAVSEALAEGMTVMDYSPKSGIAEDYAALAVWLRNLQAPAQRAFRAMRWSEQ